MKRRTENARAQPPPGWLDAQLDEALDETFPASDPPATSPMTVGRHESPSPKPERKSGKPPPQYRS
ncbi:MAG: hypothetical protein ABSC22_07780 [Roseiarcus sp.]|jgi:hypothetical protein